MLFNFAYHTQFMRVLHSGRKEQSHGLPSFPRNLHDVVTIVVLAITSNKSNKESTLKLAISLLMTLMPKY